MKSTPQLIHAAALAASLGACATAPSQTDSEPETGQLKTASKADHFQRLLSWFPGEYDNHEQVWQDELDEIEQVHERTHHIFVPVSAPAIGEHVFFVQQYLDGDPDKVYRQRLYRFSASDSSAIQLDIFAFRDEARYRDSHLDPTTMTNIAVDELRDYPGCEVFWRWQTDRFIGSMKPGACRIVSQRSGRTVLVEDDLVLTEDSIWIADTAKTADGEWIYGNRAGIPHKNRKVSYYNGWAAVKRAGINASSEDDDWILLRPIVMHNEGHTVQITDQDGNPSGYSIELVRLTYQGGGRQPILKFGVIDDASGKTLRYVWANPDARQIGINLRWLTAGVTLKPDDIHFGFDRQLDNSSTNPSVQRF